MCILYILIVFRDIHKILCKFVFFPSNWGISFANIISPLVIYFAQMNIEMCGHCFFESLKFEILMTIIGNLAWNKWINYSFKDIHCLKIIASMSLTQLLLQCDILQVHYNLFSHDSADGLLSSFRLWHYE